MKMFKVWCVVLFCGFLSLSAGEECVEGIGRICKKKLEEVISRVLLASDMPEQIMELMKGPSDGEKSTFLEGGSEDCDMELKGVNASMADERMEVNLEMVFSMTCKKPKPWEAEMKKNLLLTLGTGEEGFTVTNCSSSPADVKMSPLSDLTGMKDMLMNKVNNVMMPVLDSKTCDICQTVFKGQVDDMIKEMFVPEGGKLTFQNMEMEEKHISFLLKMSYKKAEEEQGAEDKKAEEEQGAEDCADTPTTSWKPDCPMKEGAIADMVMNNTVMENRIKEVLLNKNNPMAQAISFEGVGWEPDSENLVMKYKPRSCQTEDPHDCTDSAATCSLLLEMTAKDNELKVSPASKSCEQKTDSDSESNPEESLCAAKNCELEGAMKDVKIPVPLNMGTAAAIKTSSCGPRTMMFSFSTDMM